MKSAKWPFRAINSSYFPTSDKVPLLITAMMSTCGKYVIPCVTRILVYKDVEDTVILHISNCHYQVKYMPLKLYCIVFLLCHWSNLCFRFRMTSALSPEARVETSLGDAVRTFLIHYREMYLSCYVAVWSNDFLKYVFPNMSIHSTEWIIQQVDVFVLIYCSS